MKSLSDAYLKISERAFICRMAEPGIESSHMTFMISMRNLGNFLSQTLALLAVDYFGSLNVTLFSFIFGGILAWKWR